MTQGEINDAKPDVEAIIKQIKEDVCASEAPLPPTSEEVLEDANLELVLSKSNKECLIGGRQPKGLKGIRYRILTFLLSPLISDINRFNGLSVRLFNKLSGMITGNDTATESDLLAKTQRRINLLADLGARLDTYDKLELDVRLKRVEEQLAKLKDQESA